jgi:hypothetical protein
MTEARQPDSDPEPEHGQHDHVHEVHEHYGILPADGVEDLTDKLTGFMNEIELGGLSDIIGQVLDDFLDQCGGIPEDLTARDAFEQISRGQLVVTLAYQLGRLEGRSPQLVETLVARAIDAYGFLPVDESNEITDSDMENPKVQVYPRMRRMEYVQQQIIQVQGPGDASPGTGGGPPSE